MTRTPNPTPRWRAQSSSWEFDGDHTRVVFLGRGRHPSRQEAFNGFNDDPRRQLAWPHQVHSATILEADSAGLCGQADALTTGRRDLALSVVTADCLPIVIAGPQRLTSIHAGWRGLAAGIIPAALADLGESSETLRAWIGPAIGACCYQVGEDVAERVAAVSSSTVRIPASPRPHLDLIAAAEIQLSQNGIQQIEAVRVCTRCHPQWLWSYRRDGESAGRNWTFAWRK